MGIIETLLDVRKKRKQQKYEKNKLKKIAFFSEKHGVKEWVNGEVKPSTNNYKRLSIFDKESQRIIKGIYEDLARYSSITGILFHDDAFLTDFEDVSNQALDYYRSQGLNFNSIEELRSESMIDVWTDVKTQALIDFTDELTELIARHNGSVITARNIYARPILNPEAKRWFSQSLASFVNHYDVTAVMAMPFMEQAKDSSQWLNDLMDKIEQQTGNDKVVIELQTVDWRNQTPIDTEVLLHHINLLLQRGFIHFAYYPDDFINNHPALKKIISGMSLNTFPQQEAVYE